MTSLSVLRMCLFFSNLSCFVNIFVFIRHAKSSWADFSLKKIFRPHQKGLHDAPLMAQSLKNKLSKLDLIISSPAKRTTQTANFFL